MAKEINEKTFELNITSQLLDVSRSFLWYMIDSPIRPFMDENDWFDFLSQNTFFTEGLTQAQETNPNTGGYDVSINYLGNNGNTGRLLFLQYKSGKRAGFCKNLSSQFHGSRTNQNPHVVFTFNDAADNTQHSTLRNLASKPTIRPESVLYVFPRLTENSEFLTSCNDLLNHTSFVPVLEIDRQGLAQTPPLAIIDGVSHKYRTSYDGNISEVNYYYYAYYYEQRIISDLISELVCIQLERFFIKLKSNKNIFMPDVKYLIENLKENISSRNDKIFKGVYISGEKIIGYINEFNITSLNTNDFIVPKAPQYFSTEIPFDGLKLELEGDSNYSQINYQIM
jgi:hypothetical protein